MKKVVLMALATSLFALPAHGQPLDPSDARFLHLSYADQPYRLLVPAGYDRTRAYPLVVFLHGGAGRGRDNRRHLLEGNGMLVKMFVEEQRRFPAFILAPQTASEHEAQRNLALIRFVQQTYAIDTKRIYLIGQSLGGYGVLDLIAADDGRFAAAVIIAAGGRAADARRYAAVPTWFLHGERDEIIPVEQPRRLVSAIRRAGGSVRYTEFKGEEHGLAWLIRRDTTLVRWLFTHRK